MTTYRMKFGYIIVQRFNDFWNKLIVLIKFEIIPIIQICILNAVRLFLLRKLISVQYEFESETNLIEFRQLNI